MDSSLRFVGTGITREPVYAADDPAAADIIERGTMEGLCSQVERECFAIMRAHNLPDQHMSYFCDPAGNWSYGITESMRGWSCCNDLSVVARRKGFAPDTAVGFAAGMLSDVVWIRDAARRGDAEGLVLHAFYLGVKWSKRRIKRNWEKAAIAGQASVDGSLEGARKRAAASALHHADIRADFAERLNRLGDEQRAKEATAGKFEITRRHLNRILKK